MDAADKPTIGGVADQSVVAASTDITTNTTDPRGFPLEGVHEKKPPPKLSFSENSSSLIRCVPNERATLFVKIDCDEDSDLLPLKFEWSRGELPIENSDRFRITQTSTAVQLAVEHVQREDAGHYTLIARTKGNNVIRKDVELIVEDRSTGEDPPIFLRRLVDLSVKVGTRTRLLVEIRSSTELKLTWYRNDRRICENDRIKEINEGNFHYLEVSPVILEDGGQWMVLAENSGGRNSCIAHLNVLVPKAYKSPEFIEELRAVLTQQGTVSLECKVVGVPTPQLRWFKDSKEIKAGDVFALTANVDDPTSLGTYTCEAVNCMGKSYSSSKVHVVGRGSREGSLKPADSIPNNAPPPIFTNELRNASVRIGESIVLGCQVVVPPWPKTVIWYNKNGRIEPGERYKLIEDGLGVYMIEVKPSESCDEGEWKCVVTSYEGCVGISTCNVTMDIPKNYRKPRFMESLRAVLTEEGLVSFECKVVGFPTPVLKWFKDGQELKPGDVYQLTGTNSLGTYCCIAKNCMGENSSVAVLTVEDIQNQLNDEERLTFANQNQPPKFVVGLKSQEAKINEFFQFSVNVKATPDPKLSWFRDELPIENSERYNHYRGEQENWHLDIRSVEFVDQAEWKCVAVNDFGTSVTSSYLKLQIPRHYKKPRFLECLRAVLTEEGAVNLECKVIGVPQPVLKWYKDGVELKPGDIHRIISGQDGTCCLGTYTCEARNCMGIVASSASLLGFEEAYKNQKQEQAQENELQRNFSLSTIQEERTSQLYETPVGDITIDSKGEVSFSFDGKEVSVSLYETPDLTEEEALKIVEMYADQISEHVTEHNVVELPPLRFVKETSQSGKLLMEAVVIDISPEYFTHEEDMRTEAGLDDISITEITVHGSSGHEGDIDGKAEIYAQRSFEKMEEELSLTAPVRKRKKSRPTETTEEFYSLSKATDSQVGDEDDTSDLQTFASATQMSSRVDSAAGPDDATQPDEGVQPPKRKKGKKQTDSDSSKTTEDDAKMQDISGAVGDGLMSVKPVKVISSATEIDQNLRSLLPLAKLLKTVEHHLTIVENEVVEQSAMLMTPASAEQSIAIIRNIIDPVKQVESKLRAYSGETPVDALFQTMEEDIRKLHTSLQVIEKCVEIDETGATLIQRTSVCIIDSVGDQLIKALEEVQNIAKTFESTSLRTHIDLTADDIKQGLEITQGTIKSQALLQEAQELEAAKHLSETVAKLQAMPESEPASFAKISDAKLPDEADALKLICQPVVNIQAALEKVENELSLEENEEQIYRKVHKKVLDNIVEPIKELQSVLEIIERKAEALAGTESTEQKVNMAILDIVTPALFELNKGMEIILNESPDNVQAGMLTVSTVESMVPPLQEIQNGLAQLSQDVESGHFNEETALDVADTQKLLQTIAQSVLHFETNIERISTRLSPNVQAGLYSLKEEMSALIGNVLNDNITKYHVTLLENLKRPVDELNYCIRQIEGKSISGSLTDFIDPLHSLSDRVNLGKEIMHMSGTKQNEKNLEVLEKMNQLIRRVEIDIEEHEFKMIQREVELDEKLASEEEKLFLHMRQAMEMKIAQDEAGQNIQELLHTVTDIEATPGLDTQTQQVLSALDQGLTGLVADVEKLKESQSTREETEAATKVLTDIAKPLQAAAEILRITLTPAKELKVESLPQNVGLRAVVEELNEVVENIPEQNEQRIKLKALPIVQSVLKIVPALQTITDLPQAATAITKTAAAEKKKGEPELDSGAAKKQKMDTNEKVLEPAPTPFVIATVEAQQTAGFTGETKSVAKDATEKATTSSEDAQQAASSAAATKPVKEVAEDVSTLEDMSAMKSITESLPADSQTSASEDKTDHLKAFEANKGKVDVLLSQLKNSIASVLMHCADVDVASLQLETAQQVKASLSKLENVTECIADVHQPAIVEPLYSLSDASECRTFADAVCHLEACVVQVEECLAHTDLKDLSGDPISELKTLALPLQDLKECIKVFHNEELEQAVNLTTTSLPLTSAQVLQDIQPFVLSIKESHALETLQSLAEDESLGLLKQFIKPIQELETAVLTTVDQVHLSQIESLPKQACIAVLEKCAKPIMDIRETLLHVQEETPLSTLEDCPALQVVKEKTDVIFNLLQYCEQVDLNALENLADMSTQADISALHSCAELKSLETQLESAARVQQEDVKYLDVKDCIADGIKQIQVCLTTTEKTKVPELQDVGEIMKELKSDLEDMQSELSKSPAQQNAAEANQRVAKTMFKLKECLVHTYEAGVEKSLDEIERTFEDILQALPILEIQLAQEMYMKIETRLRGAFNATTSQPDIADDLQKLVEPFEAVLNSTKAISELESIDVEKSSLVVANLQSHLMAAFRALNEVSESLSGQGRETVLKAQDAVLAANEFIAEASEQIRIIELLQEIDSVTPNVAALCESLALAKEQASKQALLETLMQRVTSAKAFLQSIEDGLNANNPIFYRLAEENELDISSVEAALIRIEKEVIPKLETQMPTADDNALVDVLAVHLTSLQDSYAKLNKETPILETQHLDEQRAPIAREEQLTLDALASSTPAEALERKEPQLQYETALPAEEEVSTLEDISAIESLISSPPLSQAEEIPSASVHPGKIDVLLSQLKSSIVSVLAHGSEVDVGSLQLETAQQIKASLAQLENVNNCFADVRQPTVVEPPLLSLSDVSECKTFADAVCSLEACVLQVEECIADSNLQDLSTNEISELKTLAQPLHDVRECIKVFHNEELEQVLSLPTISMQLTSAQVLQDIQPFVLSIKESHALETLQSLAEDESLSQLKQFIQPIQELENAILLNIEQVHLSQAESISRQESIANLEKCAKPIWDIREALLHIQEETPLSTLEECPVLQVVKEKTDVIYHLLQYCEQVDMNALENVVDMSTQADVSALKSCVELKSVDTQLEPAATIAAESVKFFDVRECVAKGIRQIQICLENATASEVPELHAVNAVMEELQHELQNMQNELSKPVEQQNAVESQAKVAKILFKLKECLVHTYEVGVEQSVDDIEKTFADILQAIPSLEVQLSQEMVAKLESAILDFASKCTQSEYLVDFRKLIEPLELVSNSTRAISELKLVEVEKSTLAVAKLQSHLMAVFRALDEISEKIIVNERENILSLQNAVLSISEFIDTSENTLRVIELIQEVDALMPQLSFVANVVNAAKANEGKQAFSEALSLSVASGKAFLVSIEDGLKRNNPVFVKLAEENASDIQSVQAALIRMENEIVPKLQNENPSAADGMLVEQLSMHLKNLEDKLLAINNGVPKQLHELAATEDAAAKKENECVAVSEALDSDIEKSEAITEKGEKTKIEKSEKSEGLEQTETETEKLAASNLTATIVEKQAAPIETEIIAVADSASLPEASLDSKVGTVEKILEEKKEMLVDDAKLQLSASGEKREMLVDDTKPQLSASGEKKDKEEIQLETQEPSLPTEPYLQIAEEMINATLALTQNVSSQQVSKATTEVYKSVELTLSEIKNLLKTQPSTAIEDHIFLPLFKLKDLIAFIKRTPMEDVTKAAESRQVLQNANNVLLQILNGHQGLRGAMVLDIAEAILPYMGSIVSFITQVFPNDSNLCATSHAIQCIAAEINVIKKTNAPNMDAGTRSYQNLKSALFELKNAFDAICNEQQTETLLRQKESLDRLCTAVDEAQVTDAIEILQEFEVMKDFFVQLLEALKTMSQQPVTNRQDDSKDVEPLKVADDGLKEEIKNVLAVIAGDESLKDIESEAKESLQNPTDDERFAKLVFKLREHIVHTYDGGVLSANETNKKLEDLIDNLFGSNPEAARRLTEEYYSNIKGNIKEISEKIKAIEDVKLRKKVTTINPRLKSLATTAKAVKEIKSANNFAEKLEDLKKELLEIITFCDELNQTQSADLRDSIEKVKRIALKEFDYINNSEGAAQTPKILLDTYFLTSGLLDLCKRLQRAEFLITPEKEAESATAESKDTQLKGETEQTIAIVEESEQIGEAQGEPVLPEVPAEMLSTDSVKTTEFAVPTEERATEEAEVPQPVIASEAPISKPDIDEKATEQKSVTEKTTPIPKEPVNPNLLQHYKNVAKMAGEIRHQIQETENLIIREKLSQIVAMLDTIETVSETLKLANDVDKSSEKMVTLQKVLMNLFVIFDDLQQHTAEELQSKIGEVRNLALHGYEAIENSSEAVDSENILLDTLGLLKLIFDVCSELQKVEQTGQGVAEVQEFIEEKSVEGKVEEVALEKEVKEVEVKETNEIVHDQESIPQNEKSTVKDDKTKAEEQVASEKPEVQAQAIIEAKQQEEKEKDKLLEQKTEEQVVEEPKKPDTKEDKPKVEEQAVLAEQSIDEENAAKSQTQLKSQVSPEMEENVAENEPSAETLKQEDMLQETQVKVEEKPLQEAVDVSLAQDIREKEASSSTDAQILEQPKKEVEKQQDVLDGQTPQKQELTEVQPVIEEQKAESKKQKEPETILQADEQSVAETKIGELETSKSETQTGKEKLEEVQGIEEVDEKIVQAEKVEEQVTPKSETKTTTEIGKSESEAQISEIEDAKEKAEEQVSAVSITEIEQVKNEKFEVKIDVQQQDSVEKKEKDMDSSVEISTSEVNKVSGEEPIHQEAAEVENLEAEKEQSSSAIQDTEKTHDVPEGDEKVQEQKQQEEIKENVILEDLPTEIEKPKSQLKQEQEEIEKPEELKSHVEEISEEPTITEPPSLDNLEKKSELKKEQCEPEKQKAEVANEKLTEETPSVTATLADEHPVTEETSADKKDIEKLKPSEELSIKLQEYFSNIVDSVNKTSKKIADIEAQETNEKLVSIPPILESIVKISQNLKTVQSIEKSAERIVTLQKSLMDTFVAFDDLHEIAANEVKPQLEQVKEVALQLYDKIEKSEKYMETETVLLDLVKLAGSILEVCNIFEKKVHAKLVEEKPIEDQPKEEVTEEKPDEKKEPKEKESEEKKPEEQDILEVKKPEAEQAIETQHKQKKPEEATIEQSVEDGKLEEKLAEEKQIEAKPKEEVTEEKPDEKKEPKEKVTEKKSEEKKPDEQDILEVKKPEAEQAIETQHKPKKPEEAIIERSIEDKKPEEKLAEEKPIEDKPKEKVTEEEPVEKKKSIEKVTEKKYEEKKPDEHEKVVEEIPVEDKPKEKVTEKKPDEKKEPKEKVTGKKSEEKKPDEQEKLVKEKPIEDKPKEEVTEEKPDEEKEPKEKVTEKKSEEKKPAEQEKLVEETPVEDKPKEEVTEQKPDGKKEPIEKVTEKKSEEKKPEEQDILEVKKSEAEQAIETQHKPKKPEEAIIEKSVEDGKPEEKLVEEKPVEDKPKEKVTEKKPDEKKEPKEKVTGKKSEEKKPAEQEKLVEETPVEDKPKEEVTEQKPDGKKEPIEKVTEKKSEEKKPEEQDILEVKKSEAEQAIETQHKPKKPEEAIIEQSVEDGKPEEKLVEEKPVEDKPKEKVTEKKPDEKKEPKEKVTGKKSEEKKPDEQEKLVEETPVEDKPKEEVTEQKPDGKKEPIEKVTEKKSEEKKPEEQDILEVKKSEAEQAIETQHKPKKPEEAIIEKSVEDGKPEEKLVEEKPIGDQPEEKVTEKKPDEKKEPKEKVTEKKSEEKKPEEQDILEVKKPEAEKPIETQQKQKKPEEAIIERSIEDKKPEEKLAEEKPIEDKPKEKVTEEKPVDKKKSIEKVTEKKYEEKKPDEHEKVVEETPVEDKPKEKVTEKKPDEKKEPKEKVTGKKSEEKKPDEHEKVVEETPVEDKPKEKVTEQKPDEKKEPKEKVTGKKSEEKKPEEQDILEVKKPEAEQAIETQHKPKKPEEAIIEQSVEDGKLEEKLAEEKPIEEKPKKKAQKIEEKITVEESKADEKLSKTINPKLEEQYQKIINNINSLQKEIEVAEHSLLSRKLSGLQLQMDNLISVAETIKNVDKVEKASKEIVNLQKVLMDFFVTFDDLHDLKVDVLKSKIEEIKTNALAEYDLIESSPSHVNSEEILERTSDLVSKVVDTCVGLRKETEKVTVTTSIEDKTDKAIDEKPSDKAIAEQATEEKLISEEDKEKQTPKTESEKPVDKNLELCYNEIVEYVGNTSTKLNSMDDHEFRVKLMPLNSTLKSVVSCAESIKGANSVEKSKEKIVTLQKNLMDIFVLYDDLLSVNVGGFKKDLEEVKHLALNLYDSIDKSVRSVNSREVLEQLVKLCEKLHNVSESMCRYVKTSKEEEILRKTKEIVEVVEKADEEKDTKDMKEKKVKEETKVDEKPLEVTADQKMSEEKVAESVKETKPEELKTEENKPKSVEKLDEKLPKKAAEEVEKVEERPKKDKRKKSTEEEKKVDKEKPEELKAAEKKPESVEKLEEKPAKKPAEEVEKVEEKPKKDKRKKSTEEEKKADKEKAEELKAEDKKSESVEKLDEKLPKKPAEEVEKVEEKLKKEKRKKSSEEEKKADKEKPEELKAEEKKPESVEKLEEKPAKKPAEETEKVEEKLKKEKRKKSTEEEKKADKEKAEEVKAEDKKSEPDEKLDEKLPKKPAEEVEKVEEKPKKDKRKKSAEEGKKADKEKAEEVKAEDKKSEPDEKLDEKLPKKPAEEVEKVEEKPKKDKRKKSAEDEKKADKDKPEELKAEEKKPESVEKLEEKPAKKPVEETEKVEEKPKKDKRKKSAEEEKKVDKEKPEELKAEEKKPESVEKLGEKPAKKPAEETEKVEEKLKKEKRKKSAEEEKKVDKEKPEELKAEEKKPESVEKLGEKPAKKPAEETEKVEEKLKKEKRKKSAEEEKKVDKEKAEELKAEEKKSESVEKLGEKPAKKPAEETEKVEEKSKKDKRKKSAEEEKKADKEKAEEVKAEDKKSEPDEKLDEKLRKKPAEEVEKVEEKPKKDKRKKSAEDEKKADKDKPEELKAEEKKPESVEKLEEKPAKKPVEETEKVEEKPKKDKRKKSAEEEKKAAKEKPEELKAEDKKSESVEKLDEKLPKKPAEEVEKVEEKPKKDKRKKSAEEEKKADKEKPEELKAEEKKPESVEILEEKPAKKSVEETEKIEEKPKKEKRKKSAEEDKKIDEGNAEEIKAAEKRSEPTKKIEERSAVEETTAVEKKSEELKPVDKLEEKPKKDKRRKSAAEEKAGEDKRVELTIKVAEENEIKPLKSTVGQEKLDGESTRREDAKSEKSKPSMAADNQPTDKPSNLEYRDKREPRSARRAPNIELKLTNRNSATGSDVKLTCSISGAELKVDWYLDKTRIENNNKYRTTFSDGLSCLEIQAIDAADAGVYRCVAANRNGEVETSCLVTVYDIPTTKFGTTPIFTRNIRAAIISFIQIERKITGCYRNKTVLKHSHDEV
ncbi:titin-like [Anastrepha obliqua]|uniref:titin-like n=1 Tax=Anastrepha obliqua TaxID=95512 RepID=UPI00240A63FC|nr:titin-like [Anastrepha obliqua]